MVLTFILMVLNGVFPYETSGTPAFRDIIRFKYFAKEIETTGQTWATERLYKYNQNIEAYLFPEFLKKEIKFWN
tara:strand:+ start:257 stop:478 length:222 start_codon:yes stop_codon:yes gene_type:complete